MQRFACNHLEASLREMALIRDTVQRLHQLDNLSNREMGRRAWSGMLQDVVIAAGHAYLPNVALLRRLE